jgi:protoporphyrinogen oxidase
VIGVIGAGPAGLAAAWRAALAGHEVVVVDRAEAVGGLAGSFEVAGLRVDHGSHRLHPATPPAILDALRSLVGDDLQVRPRHGRIRLQGRWVGFPLRTGDLVRRMPPGFAVRAGRDAATAPLRRARADTFAEVVRAGLGPAVLDAFYRPYARKLWDAEPEALAGELARRRVSAASPADLARRLARGARPEGRVFLYPRRGFGQLSEALAEAASDAGARIRLGTAVTGLTAPSGDGDRGSPGDGRGSSSWRLHLDGGTSIDVAQVWSTAPLGALTGMVDPAPPPAVTAIAGQLRHRAMVLLYVVVDQPRWTEFDAHYFPGPEVSASRLSEPRNYRDSAEDPPDRTVLCAELPCWVGDATWKADDGDLAAALATELAAAGLPPVRPAAVTSRRAAHVYPVYGPGVAGDLATVERWATSMPGLVTFGRQGLFTPDNTHHALAMGWAAAGALDGAGHLDQRRWLAARDGFRSFVVED